MNETEKNAKKEIPTAKIYDISNAIKISWEYENCGWSLENLPAGSQLIIPIGDSIQENEK